MKKLLVLSVICLMGFSTIGALACGSDCKCGCQEGKPCTCKKEAVKEPTCKCGKEDCNCKCNKKILGIFKRKCKCNCGCQDKK